MEIKLNGNERKDLLASHREARDKREADRIKAVLLADDGWTQATIAKALFIHHETVHEHLLDYVEEKKLKPENGGSQSKLTENQALELSLHLEAETHFKCSTICAYVSEQYGVHYTVSGMTNWLHEHNFSYKQPKLTPAKADPIQQAAFVAQYQLLKQTKGSDEPIMFLDGVHPTMATKVSGGWIRTGKDKLIAASASRTRINVVGAVNLETMSLISQTYDTINSASISDFFGFLKAAYPEAPKIHVVLDRGGYNISDDTKAAALKSDIVLHHLPPYSPNLNPIERVWKVMNEMVRNNVFFKTAADFRKAIDRFFTELWPASAHKMHTRINDHFQLLQSVSSG